MFSECVNIRTERPENSNGENRRVQEAGRDSHTVM